MIVSRELPGRTVALLKFLPYPCEPPDRIGALPCKAHQPNEKSRWTCDLSIRKIYKYTIKCLNWIRLHSIIFKVKHVYYFPASYTYMQDFSNCGAFLFILFLIFFLYKWFNIFFIFVISAQIAFIQNVGHLSQKRVPGR